MHDEFDTIYLKNAPEPPEYPSPPKRPAQEETFKPTVASSEGLPEGSQKNSPEPPQKGHPQAVPVAPKITVASKTAVSPEGPHPNFKGQQKNEEVFCSFRKHWVVLLPYFAGFLLGLLFFASFILNLNWFEKLPPIRDTWFYELSFIFAMGLVLYYFHRFFVRMLNYYTANVILTNYRIVHINKTVFLQDDQNAIDLHEIQDIRKVQKGILSTILNYGHLEIFLPSIGQVRKLDYVPAPNHYFRRINLAKREYILNRWREKYLMERERAENISQAELLAKESAAQIEK